MLISYKKRKANDHKRFVRYLGDEVIEMVTCGREVLCALVRECAYLLLHVNVASGQLRPQHPRHLVGCENEAAQVREVGA